MAINALFCLDAFTTENGATLVLPATHKQEEFPSDRFVEASAAQVCAPSGSYIVLDCMLYHSGAPNRSGPSGVRSTMFTLHRSSASRSICRRSSAMISPTILPCAVCWDMR